MVWAGGFGQVAGGLSRWFWADGRWFGQVVLGRWQVVWAGSRAGGNLNSYLTLTLALRSYLTLALHSYLTLALNSYLTLALSRYLTLTLNSYLTLAISYLFLKIQFVTFIS